MKRTPTVWLLALCLLLTGCAMHRYGQLKAPQQGTVPMVRAGASNAPTAAAQAVFAPQLVSKQIEIWGVRACPGAAVPIATIYAIAAQHGISYVEPEAARTILATRTVTGVIVQWAGYAAGVTALAMSVDWIKASIAWQRGLSAASAVANWLIPALEKNVPALFCTGDDFLIDSRGCGSVLFCAQPSPAVGAFVEVLR